MAGELTAIRVTNKRGMAALTAAALFLLNFIPGISLINEGLFHADAVILAQAVENTYKTGVLQPAVWGRYGSVAINSILHLPFFLSGFTSADFTVRFSSLFFHSLSIVVFFLFVRELFRDCVQGLFAALLLSFTPFYFSPNTFGKEHGAAIFFLLLSFYLLYRGVGRKSPGLICLSSFLIAFSVAVKESALLAVPLFFLLYFQPRISLRPFNIRAAEGTFRLSRLSCLFLPFVFTLSFIFLTYFGREMERALLIDTTGRVHYLGIFSANLKFAVLYLFCCASLLTLPFFLVGAVRMFRHKKIFFAAFFLFWFIITFFYFGNLGNFMPRLLDIVVIPVYVFASYALSGLYAKDRIAAAAIVVTLAGGMLFSIYPILRSRHSYNGMKRFALYVKEKTEPHAVMVAVDDACFIEYYGGRSALSIPARDPAGLDKFIEKIKGYLNKGVPVYLVNSALIYNNQYVTNKLRDNFYGEVVAERLSEDYHAASVTRMVYNAKLIKLSLKADSRP